MQRFLKDELEVGLGKPVILCGDLNVAHTAIDIFEFEKTDTMAGSTPEERESFGSLLESSGFVDIFRHQNPDKT